MAKVDRTWDLPGEPGRLATVDAIEVAGCRVDKKGNADRVEVGGDMFSVYLHRKGEGADCIADRNTIAEAIALGNLWAAKLGVPLNIYGRESNETE